jgi:serine/threonine-protein kinase HipA
MDEKIIVYIWPQEIVGKLWFRRSNEKQSSTFEYDEKWLENNKETFALETSLPLSRGALYSGNVPIFRSLCDSSPDRWGRTLILRKEKKEAEKEGRSRKTLSELDFLLGVNDEIRQGALRFKRKENEDFLSKNEKGGIPPLIFLPKLLGATQQYLKSNESDEDLKILLAGGSSLGGARPKASVYNNDILYIAKFPKDEDIINKTLWETHALILAEKAGINTTKWKIEKINEKHVLLLKRFDREGKNRIPFISAMSMLQAKDNEKHSYVEIAQEIIKNGNNVEKNLEELWKRMALNVFISNVDDHLRNHGFLLYSNKGWELSPVYDINPSDKKENILYHELNINEYSNEGTIDNILSTTDYFRIRKDRAQIILKEVNNAVSQWKDVAKNIGIDKKEIDYMSDSFKYENIIYSV